MGHTVQLSCSVDRYGYLSNYLLTCHQVSLTCFRLLSLTLENGPSDAQRGPRFVKGLPVKSMMAWWKKGVLQACYVTRRGDRPEEGEKRGEGCSVG